jgi:hypothetical protein
MSLTVLGRKNLKEMGGVGRLNNENPCGCAGVRILLPEIVKAVLQAPFPISSAIVSHRNQKKKPADSGGN